MGKWTACNRGTMGSPASQEKSLGRSEKGQGLVEYALILVLVAIVVIFILALLGPAVGNVFSNIMIPLRGSGVITSVSAQRTGGGHGNSVEVSISVSTNTSVTVSDSQSGQSFTMSCNGSCSLMLIGVGHDAGTITVTAAAGGHMTAAYPVKL